MRKLLLICILFCFCVNLWSQTDSLITLIISPSTLESVESEGNGKGAEIVITTNAPGWISHVDSVEENIPDWLIVEKDEKTDTAIVKVLPNDSTVIRTATITFVAVDEDGKEIKGNDGINVASKLTVVQKGKDIKPPYTIYVNPSLFDKVESMGNGKGTKVIVSTNASGWKCVVDSIGKKVPDWLTVEKVENTDTAVIKVLPNDSIGDRTAGITFISVDEKGDVVTDSCGKDVKVGFTVEQKANVSISLRPSVLEEFEANGNGDGSIISVSTNAPQWKFEVARVGYSVPGWITVMKGKEKNTVVVKVAANETTKPRNASIIFAAFDVNGNIEKDCYGNDVKDTLFISQKEAEFAISLTLSELKDIDAEGNGEGTIVNVTTNAAGWDFAVDSIKAVVPEWVKVEKREQTSTAIIKVEANDSIASRNASITFFALNEAGEVTKDSTGNCVQVKFSIMQKGASVPSEFSVENEDEWKNSIELMDKNNPNNDLSIGIRSGGTLLLSTIGITPQMIPEAPKGVEWQFEWSLNKTVLIDKVEIPHVKDTVGVSLVCKASLRNMRSNKVEWSDTIYQKDLKVFPIPAIPTSFMKKGDGTSGTWLIYGYSAKDKSVLKMGTYSQKGESIEVTSVETIMEKDVTSVETRMEKDVTSKGNISWFKKDGYSDKTNVCLFVVKDYGHDVKITSDLLTLNGVLSWDGSTYTQTTVNDITRGENATTGINTLKNGKGKSVGYSLNGAQVGNVVGGVIIVRMEDGTVKKMYSK